MSKPWIFVSPSSRGLGHALTRHLLRTTTLPILATGRSDPAFAQLPQDAASRLTVLRLDVTDEPSLAAAAQRAAALFPPATHHLRLAFALPGVLHPERSPAQVDAAAALATLQVNVLGPLLLMKHFGDFLPRKNIGELLGALPEAEAEEAGPAAGQQHLPPHAVWTSLSARVGSIADNRLGGWYSYRASKAGVNALSRTFDLHLRHRCGDRAISVAYHPGTVKTGLSQEFWASVKPDKLFSPEFAAGKLAEVACSRALTDRGRIWDWKAEEIQP